MYLTICFLFSSLELNKHRHSIGVMSSYQNLLSGYHQKSTTAPSVQVFSTAVISGSTSAPDLRDSFPALPFSTSKYILNASMLYLFSGATVLCQYKFCITTSFCTTSVLINRVSDPLDKIVVLASNLEPKYFS